MNDDTASSTTRQGPPSATARSRFDDALALLERHLPWLSISEPAPTAVAQSTPGVSVFALLCGDKGLILVAFKNSNSNGPQKASIEILTPPGCPVPNQWKDSITGASGEIHATSQRFVLEVPIRDLGTLFQLMRVQNE
jgi:hypothetical protein